MAAPSKADMTPEEMEAKEQEVTKRGGIGGVTALWRMTLMPGGMSNLREIAHQGGRHVRAQRRDMGEGHRTEIQ